MQVRNATIISLSAGTIGEAFVRHEVEIGMKRLQAYGLNVVMTPHALCGIEYIKNHPEARAKDLLDALCDDSIDMILCAIGGIDTYRLLPYLFENDELKKAFRQKIFLGFSDTTINHLMLHKLGAVSYYGQSFLADICELDKEMLPYSARYFEELIRTGKIQQVTPSNVWYEERTDWSPAAIGTPRKRHENEGFQLLQGRPVFSGKILGGCIDSIYEILEGGGCAEAAALSRKYSLFPAQKDWQGRILLLETSEMHSSPEKYREMLLTLKKTGIFHAVSGVICGKPMDEMYFEEYKRILVDAVGDPALPIVANLNIGHATPRCIIPFGVDAVVDTTRQVIEFQYANR